jgi:hypothetical protein
MLDDNVEEFFELDVGYEQEVGGDGVYPVHAYDVNLVLKCMSAAKRRQWRLQAKVKNTRRRMIILRNEVAQMEQYLHKLINGNNNLLQLHFNTYYITLFLQIGQIVLLVEVTKNKANIPQYCHLVKSLLSLFSLCSIIIIFADRTSVIYIRPGSYTCIMKGMHAW